MGGTGRTAAPVAENHQERCNPAIRAAALMFIINRLKMAKDMHRSKVTKYEAPTSTASPTTSTSTASPTTAQPCQPTPCLASPAPTVSCSSATPTA